MAYWCGDCRRKKLKKSDMCPLDWHLHCSDCCPKKDETEGDD